MKNSWFPDAKYDEKIKMRLFCFPFAGGGAFTYHHWKNLLPDSINVCPAHLPGRADLINEQCFTNLHKLTAEIFGEIKIFLDRPFAFFGYSMGAIIGFELARLLQKDGIVADYLFVAAARPPQLVARPPIVYNLPVEEFKKEILSLNGTPREVLENKELFDLILPLLRGDFELIETYKFSKGEPLKSPIFAFGGNKDKEVSEVEMKEWKIHTTSNFRSKMFESDHFFINTKTSEILEDIKKQLREIKLL